MRLLWFERAGEQSVVAAWSDRFKGFDRWLKTHADLGEWLHWIEHHWRPGCVHGGLADCSVSGPLSGLTIIAPDEVAVVRRFGAPRAGPGAGLVLALALAHRGRGARVAERPHRRDRLRFVEAPHRPDLVQHRT